ncbi:MAG: hypothetical protein GAK40_01267 [Burkholderia plantarii]|nr:MAG: hypothetical protein GAK40_01267 [Burkholderia plantarii]
MKAAAPGPRLNTTARRLGATRARYLLAVVAALACAAAEPLLVDAVHAAKRYRAESAQPPRDATHQPQRRGNDGRAERKAAQLRA